MTPPLPDVAWACGRVLGAVRLTTDVVSIAVPADEAA